MGVPEPAGAYRPDIDGLRALAVLPVVLFHAGVAGVGGGFVGVDVFFVISGFLLTGILVRELEQQRFSIADFYVRRARRILPALAVVVATCLLAGFFLMAPEPYAQLGRSAQAVATITANIQFARARSDYWAQSTLAEQPLLHTWSLAVEEQFYIGLPLLLWLMYRIGATRQASVERVRSHLLLMLAMVAGASLAHAERLLPARVGEAFYLVMPRAWELLAGSLLAVWMHRRPPAMLAWARDLMGAVGVALILAAVFLFEEGMRFPGLAALVPCVGAVLVIHSGGSGLPPGQVQRLLSTRPLVFVGLVSYSLYLWHWPVLVFTGSAGWHARELPHLALPLQLAVMLLLAWLSWRFVETPFRRGAAARLGSSRMLGASVASLAALWCGGLLAFEIGQERWPLEQSIPPLIRRMAHDMLGTPGLRCEGSGDPGAIRRDGGGCMVGAGGKPPEFVLFGDSHARMYTEGVHLIAEERNVRVLVMARSSCVPALGLAPPTRPECRELTRASIDYLMRSPVQRVVLAGYWIDIAQDDAGAAALAGEIDATVEALRRAGKDVVLLKDVPELATDRTAYRAAVRSLRTQGAPVYGPSLQAHERAQARIATRLDEIARRHGALVLDPANLLCRPDMGCLLAQHSRALYRDKHHLTDAAAIRYRELFLPVIEAPTGQ